MLECALYNSIKDRFPFMFQNVVLGSIKFSFQMDHQVDITMYLVNTTTLCHSKELAFLITS